MNGEPLYILYELTSTLSINSSTRREWEAPHNICSLPLVWCKQNCADVINFVLRNLGQHVDTVIENGKHFDI